MSSESIRPDSEPNPLEIELITGEEIILVPDLNQQMQAVTSLCLGLFSISPVLFIFQAWSFIPALLLCGWAFWQAWKLRQQGTHAVLLQIASWVMVVLSVDVFFIYPDLSYQVRAVMFEGTVFFSVITSVAVAGIFALPVFAIFAVGYGFKAKRDIFGITAGVIHLVCWLIFGVEFLIYTIQAAMNH